MTSLSAVAFPVTEFGWHGKNETRKVGHTKQRSVNLLIVQGWCDRRSRVAALRFDDCLVIRLHLPRDRNAVDLRECIDDRVLRAAQQDQVRVFASLIVGQRLRCDATPTACVAERAITRRARCGPYAYPIRQAGSITLPTQATSPSLARRQL